MNLSTSKQISLVNALIITALFVVLDIISIAGHFSFGFYSVVAFSPFVFLFVYFVSTLLFNRYIKEKLQVIYKSIGLLKPEANLEKPKKNKNDELEIVNNVVLKWSEEKKKEIDNLESKQKK